MRSSTIIGVIFAILAIWLLSNVIPGLIVTALTILLFLSACIWAMRAMRKALR